LLSEAAKHGQIFTPTGGRDHLAIKYMFKSIELKQRKMLRGGLSKDNTLHQQQERIEPNAWEILEMM
jgi:hypothetical protein